MLWLAVLWSVATAPVGAVAQEPLGSAENYKAQCLQNGVRCTLTYPEGPTQAKPEAPRPSEVPPAVSSPPALGGFLGVLIVLIVLGAIIVLWMFFGSGGVLLSRAPMATQPNRSEKPENWQSTTRDANEKPRDFLAYIAAMPDRREALVQLLRQCLLQSAKRTGTHVLRSDTERTVFVRLPKKMEHRDELRRLLLQTELAHYGGKVPAESDFSELLQVAQPLLFSGDSARV